MTNEEAVKEVCAIGRKLESDLDRAEAEAEIRRWRPMPNGGHDPEFVRALQQPDLVRDGLPEMLPADKPGNGINTEGAKRT